MWIIPFGASAEKIRPVLSAIFGEPPELPHVNRSAPKSCDRAVLNDDLKREHDRYGEIDFDTFGFSSGFIR